jgi:hypothetical protein
MQHVKITGDTNMILYPKLEVYDPNNPPADLLKQLVIWGSGVYVLNN